MDSRRLMVNGYIVMMFLMSEMTNIKCDCASMVHSVPESLEHGHHVNCALNTEKVEMAKLKFDGTWCIMDVDDALEQLKLVENKNETWEFSKVWMTRNEFDALPEFIGW